MKKILLLILLEILLTFAIILIINLYIFEDIIFSLKPLIMMIKLNFSHGGMLSIPLKFSLYVVIAFALWVLQFVFVYQAFRKGIMEFRNRSKGTQGTAEWATTKQLEKAKLLPDPASGIVLGQTIEAKLKEVAREKYKLQKPGKIISNDSEYHTLIVGATGSGKGVGIIMPTLFAWKDSVIIVDPKGESREITGGYRSKFSEVFYFDPTSEKSCHINPLDFIPRDNQALGEIANLCLNLHPDQSKDAYWDKVPRMMLEMLVGHVILKGKRKSLPEAISILNSAGGKFADIFAKILHEYEVDPVDRNDLLFPVAENVMAHANMFYQMASGNDAQQIVTHITSVKSDLGSYSDTIAAKALDQSDFKITDIADGERPISLYLCVPVKDLARIMPMFKLIYSLIIKSLLGREQNHKHKLLLILDEFSQFKKFEVVAEQIPFVRSFGIRIMAAIQSLGQLQEHYGQDGTKALLDNFQIKLFLRASDIDTCSWFERMLGKQTILNKKTSFSSNRKGVGVESWSESSSEVGRSLLTAEEVKNLPGDHELVFCPPLNPYLAKKILYYSDKRYKNLVRLPILEPNIAPIEQDTDSFSDSSTDLNTEEKYKNYFRLGNPDYEEEEELSPKQQKLMDLVNEINSNLEKKNNEIQVEVEEDEYV